MPQTTKSSIKARGRWKTGRFPAASFFLAAALLFLSACSTTPEVREAKYLTRGKSELAAKQYKKAVIDFKVASQNMPKDAEPVYQLGLTYLSVGGARQAVEAFTKAATLNPKHEGAQYQMALVKVGSNKPEVVQDAKQVLLAYLVKHSDDAEGMGSLALAEAKLGEKPEALKMLDAGAEKDPANMRPAAMIIALYAARGDVDTAKQIARELSERLPNSPDAAILRAQVSLATHDTADTDAQISRALALKRDFRPPSNCVSAAS
jgi:tetratricopeptide (TPR) repeat protein